MRGPSQRSQSVARIPICKNKLKYQLTTPVAGGGLSEERTLAHFHINPSSSTAPGGLGP